MGDQSLIEKLAKYLSNQEYEILSVCLLKRSKSSITSPRSADHKKHEWQESHTDTKEKHFPAIIGVCSSFFFSNSFLLL